MKVRQAAELLAQLDQEMDLHLFDSRTGEVAAVQEIYSRRVGWDDTVGSLKEAPRGERVAIVAVGW